LNSLWSPLISLIGDSLMGGQSAARADVISALGRRRHSACKLRVDAFARYAKKRFLDSPCDQQMRHDSFVSAARRAGIAAD
jgi:hypothetical protein